MPKIEHFPKLLLHGPNDRSQGTASGSLSLDPNARAKTTESNEYALVLQLPFHPSDAEPLTEEDEKRNGIHFSPDNHAQQMNKNLVEVCLHSGVSRNSLRAKYNIWFI